MGVGGGGWVVWGERDEGEWRGEGGGDRGGPGVNMSVLLVAFSWRERTCMHCCVSGAVNTQVFFSFFLSFFLMR